MCLHPMHKFVPCNWISCWHFSIWLPLTKFPVTIQIATNVYSGVKHLLKQTIWHFAHLGARRKNFKCSSSLKQLKKRVLNKAYNLWLVALQSTVIRSIKHILYINNNRQLKWVLCQGALVTQCADEHTPCACGIVSLTPAIGSFT